MVLFGWFIGTTFPSNKNIRASAFDAGIIGLGEELNTTLKKWKNRVSYIYNVCMYIYYYIYTRNMYIYNISKYCMYKI
jgi:hypothetical protein